jgi:hypothetical protein
MVKSTFTTMCGSGGRYVALYGGGRCVKTNPLMSILNEGRKDDVAQIEKVQVIEKPKLQKIAENKSLMEKIASSLASVKVKKISRKGPIDFDPKNRDL